MRTTLNIDDDVLAAAKGIAERRGTTLGRVLSQLARQALKPKRSGSMKNGVPLLPIRDDPVPITLERVNQLRDGDEPL